MVTISPQIAPWPTDLARVAGYELGFSKSSLLEARTKAKYYSVAAILHRVFIGICILPAPRCSSLEARSP